MHIDFKTMSVAELASWVGTAVTEAIEGYRLEVSEDEGVTFLKRLQELKEEEYSQFMTALKVSLTDEEATD